MRLNPWSIVVPGACAAVAIAEVAWGAVHPTSQLFGATLHHTSRRSAVALTFDDGPNPVVTPQLLALLARHDAQATFFLVGRHARACPELVREIAARGHTIGNHTETHPNLFLMSARRIEDELRRCQDSIAAALTSGIAAESMWMRPPFGFRGPQLAPAVRRAGLRGVAMWSRNFRDWKPEPPARLTARMARVNEDTTATAPATRANNLGGPILLLHDGDFRHQGADRRNVLTALEHWLPRWRDAGLEFVTIDGAASAI